MNRKLFTITIIIFTILAFALYGQPKQNNVNSSVFIIGLIGTWAAIAIAFTGLYLTIKKDRRDLEHHQHTTQDRIDNKIRSLAKETIRDIVGATEWKMQRDERIREVTRDLFHREFQLDLKMTEVSAKLESLSQSVEQVTQSVEVVRQEVQDAVTRGVSAGVAEAAEKIARERLKDFVLPTRGG